MAFTTDNARVNQLKGAETKRLVNEDIPKLARLAVVRALKQGDARVGLAILQEIGALKAERKVQSDSTLTEAISMLSESNVGAEPTQAAAKGGPGEIRDTVSHKIFPSDAQPDDNKGDESESD